MRPLTAGEISDLERQVGLVAPSAFREYLDQVGLFQDLTHAASDYEVFDRVQEFVQARQFLQKNFDESATMLFPFAGDGAGDVIGAREIEGETLLFFADHETLEAEEIGTFCDWLSDVVDAALTQQRPENDDKIWSVQFSFRAPDANPILQVLRRFGSVELGGWTSKGATSAGVHCFEAPFTFERRNFLLKRSEYWTWNQPSFAFNLDESIAVPPNESLIRRLDAAFKAAGPVTNW